MSSIIEGYNYDIFISYRKKYNKGDEFSPLTYLPTRKL
jgi:hypothetical protein